MDSWIDPTSGSDALVSTMPRRAGSVEGRRLLTFGAAHCRVPATTVSTGVVDAWRRPIAGHDRSPSRSGCAERGAYRCQQRAQPSVIADLQQSAGDVLGGAMLLRLAWDEVTMIYAQ